MAKIWYDELCSVYLTLGPAYVMIYLHIHLYIAKMNQQADDTNSYTNLPVWEQDCELLHTSFATLNRVKQTCRRLVTSCVQPKIPQ